MNLSDLKQSKYLKQQDVGQGVIGTIMGLSQQNVAQDGAEPDIKTVVHFHELGKPMVLNSTNGQLIAKITGQTENIERTWIGARVVLYTDPNVSYGGKLVGGIRVRAPKINAGPVPAYNPHIAAQSQVINQPVQQQVFSDGAPVPSDDGPLPF
jgi:hypothetical protein